MCIFHPFLVTFNVVECCTNFGTPASTQIDFVILFISKTFINRVNKSAGKYLSAAGNFHSLLPFYWESDEDIDFPPVFFSQRQCILLPACFSPPVTSGSRVRSSDCTWPPALLFSQSGRMWTCEGRQWGVKADTQRANCSDLFWWFTYLVSVSASSPWGQSGSETQDPTHLLLPPLVDKKRTPVLLYACKKTDLT